MRRQVFTRRQMIRRICRETNRGRSPRLKLFLASAFFAAASFLWGRGIALFFLIAALLILFCELYVNRQVLALLFGRFRIESGFAYREPDPYAEEDPEGPVDTRKGFMYRHAEESYKIRSIGPSEVSPRMLDTDTLYYFVTDRSGRLIAIYPDKSYELGEDLRPFFE